VVGGIIMSKRRFYEEYWRVTQSSNFILHQFEPRKFENILIGYTWKPYEFPYTFVYLFQQFNRPCI